jgi:Protein of unknown function (DUF1569)
LASERGDSMAGSAAVRPNIPSPSGWRPLPAAPSLNSMPNLDASLAANRSAVDDLIAVAERSAANWATPRAPGKWSPAQVTEHVARSLEEGANVVAGRPSKFPTLPSFIRPVAGWMLRRTVRTGKFPKAKTNRAMNPERTSPTVPTNPGEARARLQSAFSSFERECRARVASGRPVESPAFGIVAVEDYARFTELHTRHHTRQIPS